jgi:hypothetical protein
VAVAVAEETTEELLLEALVAVAQDEEMLLEQLVQRRLQVLVLAVAVDTPLVETVLLVKFGLGIESNGLFCKS